MRRFDLRREFTRIAIRPNGKSFVDADDLPPHAGRNEHESEALVAVAGVVAETGDGKGTIPNTDLFLAVGG